MESTVDEEADVHDIALRDEQEEGVSFPAAEEVRIDIGSPKKSVSRRCLWTLAVLLVVFVVTISIGVVKNEKSKSTVPNTSNDAPEKHENDEAKNKNPDHDGTPSGEVDTPASNTSNADDAPVIIIPNPRNASIGAVMVHLVDEKISELVFLEDEESPQYKAAYWLAEVDEANLPIPTTPQHYYPYMVRYVMALNYFALHGEDWNDDAHFLSERDVCGWHNFDDYRGIFCSTEGLPYAIHLYDNNLVGQLPSENGLLFSLNVFDVRMNKIDGWIPYELCNLSLVTLDLNTNELGGGKESNMITHYCFIKIGSNSFSYLLQVSRLASVKWSGCSSYIFKTICWNQRFLQNLGISPT